MADALHWTAEKNGNFNPPWIIRYDPTPEGKKNEDGSTSWSMTFPVLQLTEWPAEPEKVARSVALKLNLIPEMVEALKACAKAMHEDHPGDNSFWEACERAEALVEKVDAK